MQVEVQWESGDKWYPGVISMKHANNDLYDVVFTNGAELENCDKSIVRAQGYGASSGGVLFLGAYE